MIKLFISLYLAVVISLLTINWGAELLWLSLSTKDNHAELQHVVKLAKIIPSLIQNNPENITRFTEETGLALSILQI